MELLPEGQTNTTTEVAWEDQQKINKFSTLVTAKDDYTSELEKAKSEKEYLDDLALELELVDDEEKINYKIGEAFILLKATDAVARIEKENEDLDSKIAHFESKIEELDETLNELKVQLYAKFGKNINLER
ncbi:Piso0_002134 [Millerozyma farinosa CBS 7064]|uniref:Prefoldin subunit 4 n=1 Tax=Pichia sorbitophila (strain ATCC MYA-4447 / BCRC 22081 / CBS 7064 / NBRC 10061 / NRRL Y-12695) TaxID=559304 RepID=G8YBS8_PICSO|nr:Piso0_002134 [Millerozyma farinosa CBS 7064]